MRIPMGKAAMAAALAAGKTAKTTASKTTEGQKATTAKGESQHKPKARVRAGWKTGLPLRADGTTGQNDCLCGCGTKVKNRFAQGHDARVHSWLLAVERGERTKASLPAETQRALANGILVVRVDEPEDGHVLAPQPKAAKAARPAAKTTKAA